MFTLSQTVAGSWVITLPNPEERGWSTQIAQFDADAAEPGSRAREMIETAAGATLAFFAHQFPDRGYRVTSHDEAAREAMEKRVDDAFKAQSVPLPA